MKEKILDPDPYKMNPDPKHWYRYHYRPVHLLVFGQDEVVAGEGHAEDDGGDALEAVDPLLPLGPLASHIEHPGQIEEQL